MTLKNFIIRNIVYEALYAGFYRSRDKMKYKRYMPR
jgi:hypothetical protein